MKLSATFLTMQGYWKARDNMTNITTVVYTALIVFGIIGLTEVAFAWHDIRGRDKTDDDIQEQWCSENIKQLINLSERNRLSRHKTEVSFW